MAEPENLEDAATVPGNEDAVQCSTSISDKFFTELIQLAKTLDSKVSLIEAKAKKAASMAGISSNKKGEFGAPIADDINDDLLDINNVLDHKLKFIQEQNATIDSVINQCLHTYEDNRNAVMKVQEYAAQYGYAASEESKLKCLDRETLSAELDLLERSQGNESAIEEPNIISEVHLNEESVDTMNLEQNEVTNSRRLKISQVHATDSTHPKADTPKLLQIGLSKHTLKNMGFTFKDDVRKSDDSITIDVKHRDLESKCHMINSINSTVEDTSITTDISLIRAPVPNIANTSNEMSRVEISPGLIVKRPSSKKRYEKIEYDKAACDDNIAKSQIPLEADNSFNGQPLPTHHTLDNVKSSASVEESPQMPMLKTIDIRKYFATTESNIASQQESKIGENEIQLDDCKENFLKAKDSPARDADTPEMPVLKTVNLAKYMQNFNTLQKQ